MATDKSLGDKSLIEILSPGAREDILRQYPNNNKELTKLQREYLVEAPTTKTIENVKRRCFLKNVEHLEREKDDLVAKLEVALGTMHLKEYDRYIEEIQAHVRCQEVLQEKIDVESQNIRHLQIVQVKADREIYNLNFKATAESSYNDSVKKALSNLEFVENQLDVSRKRECALITENVRLRNLIVDMLFERSLFNRLWLKMMIHLNHGRKFLVDLAEKAINFFEQGTEACEKLDSIQWKKGRDIENKMAEMQELVKRVYAEKFTMQFLRTKGKIRELGDLEAREYKRRELFKRSHIERIQLYKAIQDRILRFSGVDTIAKAAEKFQEQEDFFYSYFQYMNDLNFQVETLNHTLDDLITDNQTCRRLNKDTASAEKATIKNLQKELAQQKERTKNKQKEVDTFEKNLQHLLAGLHDIFNVTQSDETPILSTLGDHTEITLINVQQFLKIFENNLNNIMASVYVAERKHKSRTERIVRKVDREIEHATPIGDIVLAQQCPECAEGENLNPYDEEYVMPQSKDEIKMGLREKVKQPEMQYLLHSISQCRLPRSRMLANKKY